MNTKRSCLYSLLAIVLLWGVSPFRQRPVQRFGTMATQMEPQLGLTNQSGSGGSIVYNQFTVTGSGWNISQIWSNNVFYNISFDGNNLVYNSTVPASASPISTTANWDIRTGMVSPGGGTSVASGNLSSATLTPTGLLGYAGLPEYQLSVSGLTGTIAGGNLTAGNYWLAVYTDNTYGGNVVNDFASTAANAVGTPTGATTMYGRKIHSASSLKPTLWATLLAPPQVSRATNSMRPPSLQPSLSSAWVSPDWPAIRGGGARRKFVRRKLFRQAAGIRVYRAGADASKR